MRCDGRGRVQMKKHEEVFQKSDPCDNGPTATGVIGEKKGGDIRSPHTKTYGPLQKGFRHGR